MPTPSRILYAGQRATLYINGISDANPKRLAIQSASLDITNPIDNVLTFGQLGAANRVQKEISKTKITLKYYPMKETGTISGLLSTDINTLVNNALSGVYSTIVVEPYGFTGSGILTNLSFNASVNSFVDSDISFEGLGYPVTGGTPAGLGSSTYISNDENGYIPVSVTPITHDKVGVGYYGGDYSKTWSQAQLTGTIANAKFSFDIPNETITSLGSTITGDHSAVYSSNRILAKPPFKATLNVDGTASSKADTADFGVVTILLPKGIVTSQSYNQGVGTVGATFSYTTEDVTANFYLSPFTGITFSGDAV